MTKANVTTYISEDIPRQNEDRVHALCLYVKGIQKLLNDPYWANSSFERISSGKLKMHIEALSSLGIITNKQGV